MRPINKGFAPKQYSRYQDARDDLADKIGWYCSYCEMPVKNLLAVEHIVPRNKGGAELEWHNFLLSCTYCNSIKSNNNNSRLGYYWADVNDTFHIFTYHPFFPILPHASLNKQEYVLAENTIKLTGLDKQPAAIHTPTLRDTRWVSRQEAWGIAYKSLANWRRFPVLPLLNQIVNTAVGTGHFSIWMSVFEAEKGLQSAFIDAFVGTQKSHFNI